METIVNLIEFALGMGGFVFVVFLVLLAMPQSRLRSVCMEVVKWLVACVLALLTISPLDVVPDFIPLAGQADDLCYIIGAICAVASARHEHKQRQLMAA